MTYQILDFLIKDYEEALDLWKRCEGIGLSAADEKEPLKVFLDRHEGFNFIARNNSKLVGTCLCGMDGRRGYIYHLAVDPEFRRVGIGQALVDRTLQKLRETGIQKCHIMVYGSNQTGLKFWKDHGWVLRPEIELMSFDIIHSKHPSPC